MSKTYKIPASVLVLIYTSQLEVLLLRRADSEPHQPFWQSVTGSKDHVDEPWAQTAAREVWEETGIDCRTGTPLAPELRDWGCENVYEIYPRWRHRYHPAVSQNTERLFGLQVPARLPVVLSPREHTDWVWLPYREAAWQCTSASNAEACLWLPRVVA